MRLTDIAIRALRAPEIGAVVYYDDKIAGFGVRVSKGGTKSFVLTHGKLRRRETIGRVGVITLADARIEATRRLAEYTLGRRKLASIIWPTAIEDFVEDGKIHLKERTLQDYRRIFERHFRFGDLKLTEISPEEIQRRLTKLRDTPVEQHHAFVVLGTFFRWAHRKYYVEHNPMDRMVSRYRYRPRTRILSDEELKRVWVAAGEDYFGTLVRLLILTGQRVGEIAGLSTDMFEQESVKLPSWLTKNRREHTFPLGTLARRYMAKLDLPKSGTYRCRSFHNYQRLKARLDKASGVSDWTLHDLRRTFASGLAAQRIALPVIERLLNHVSGSFAGIVGVYQRYDYRKEMREAIDAWEAHLKYIVAQPHQVELVESDMENAVHNTRTLLRSHTSPILSGVTATGKNAMAGSDRGSQTRT